MEMLVHMCMQILTNISNPLQLCTFKKYALLCYIIVSYPFSFYFFYVFLSTQLEHKKSHIDYG